MKFPPKTYKTVCDLESNENLVDIKSFMETDDVVHTDTSGSEVVEFFNGKSILITGGSGFLGKLITEKLLRSCRHIKQIYLILRPKRNKDLSARLEEIVESVVFSELRKVQPDFHEKIVPVYGDMLVPNLGLKEKDIEMLRNDLNVIFHVAATVKLDEKLRITAQTNIAGTLDILNLAKSCKNISSFVHVSTAYSNTMREEIDEILYKPSIEAEPLLAMTKSYGESFDLIEKSIIGKLANSYITTKKIAEYTMKTHGHDLPVCIVRPAIVANTYKEPIKSYIDNFYGSTGVVTNSYVGLMRALYADEEKIIEVVPADYVANFCIVAAYKNSINGRRNLKIYNYVSSTENPIKVGDLLNLSLFYGYHAPTNKCIWYPFMMSTNNFYVYLLYAFFVHFVPAFCFDLCLRLVGKKPWMLSVFKKIHKFSNSIHRYASTEWKFSMNNTNKLWEELSDVDKRVFPFSMSKCSFDWNEYVSQNILGVRLYLLNDKIDTMKNAHRRLKKLYYLHVGTKYVLTFIVIYLVASFLETMLRR